MLTPLYGREVAACLHDPNITLQFPSQGNTMNSKTENERGGIQEMHDKLCRGRFSKVQQEN